MTDTAPNGRKLVTQQSTVWTRRQHAVCVRRAVKTYGSKTAPHVILENLNMTVPKGCIYGLLGASGCGKTTLLSCIVGRRTLNSGEIWVLGGKPGSRGSGVPGPRIGYMPQEIALYGEFTIRETLLYFGWVAGMTSNQIDDKMTFLLKLLQLPSSNKYIKNFSGGQQRRVSLAATLLHDPELLILDEPTVGVDPILRQSIWDYLVKLTSENGTTIIITTHYIDETKQAHTIGLMRGGKFLAEDSPNSLLEKYNTDSLEDAFLKLSILQNRGKRRRSSILSDIVAAATATMPETPGVVNEGFDNSSEISGEFGENMSVSNIKIAPIEIADPLPPDDETDWSWKDALHIFTPHHMKALIWKNFLWLIRNFGMLSFIIGLPVIQIVLFCLSIGRDPVGLKLGVINNEIPIGSECTFNSSCNYERLSCRYLDYLEKKKHTLVMYNNTLDAKIAVTHGKAWGIIEIPPQFSEMITARIELGRYANDSVIDGSEINIQLDMSNQQVAYMLQRDVIFALEDMAKDIAVKCQLNVLAMSLPIRFNQPIYGPEVPNFTDFAAPGVILTISFFLAVALTSGAMLIERNEGILERCLVSGITAMEIMCSHITTQFIAMLAQSALVIIFAFFVFDLTNHGNFALVIILTVLSGTCGMTFGKSKISFKLLIFRLNF
ncbi:hypothetical protein AAG570_009404 [Ranatra chinensis]|uniref:ABC transporter domain-containing protein n=1 Tax=Ranatra chinensis TaxID=642074 RepID=A0ABD0ZA24_9HEMI